MIMSFRGFLACGAVLAVCLAACTVETTTSGLGTTSSTTGSSGSGTAGSTTSASTTSSTTTSGSGGSGGGDSDASGGTGGAPADGGGDVSSGGACFPDDADAGAVSACSTLGYAKVDCSDDGGMDPPLGAFICTDLEGDLKIAAFRELYDCLKAIPGADGGADDACSTAHETAATACSVKLFSRTTCTVPTSPIDGGMKGCADVVASCPGDAGAGGVSLADCQRFLSPFNDAARQFIFDCYFDPSTPPGAGCADKFENECVFPPQSR
jgi:hypothetical protein